jgi:opacity protein-like surface antigen
MLARLALPLIQSFRSIPKRMRKSKSFFAAARDIGFAIGDGFSMRSMRCQRASWTANRFVIAVCSLLAFGTNSLARAQEHQTSYSNHVYHYAQQPRGPAEQYLSGDWQANDERSSEWNSSSWRHSGMSPQGSTLNRPYANSILQPDRSPPNSLGQSPLSSVHRSTGFPPMHDPHYVNARQKQRRNDDPSNPYRHLGMFQTEQTPQEPDFDPSPEPPMDDFLFHQPQFERGDQQMDFLGAAGSQDPSSPFTRLPLEADAEQSLTPESLSQECGPQVSESPQTIPWINEETAQQSETPPLHSESCSSDYAHPANPLSRDPLPDPSNPQFSGHFHSTPEGRGQPFFPNRHPGCQPSHPDPSAWTENCVGNQYQMQTRSGPESHWRVASVDPQQSQAGGENYFSHRAAHRRGIAGYEELTQGSNSGFAQDCGFDCGKANFYLKGYGASVNLLNLVSTNQTLLVDNGGGFGIALGQRQGRNLRTEIEYGWRSNPAIGMETAFGIEPLTGKIKSQAGMANAYWELINFSHRRLTPYLGAGLGFSRLDAELSDGHGQNFTLERSRDSSFAYQVMSGVSWRHGRYLDLFVEYRWFRADAFNIDTSAGQPGGRYDYRANNLQGGLRWKF